MSFTYSDLEKMFSESLLFQKIPIEDQEILRKKYKNASSKDLEKVANMVSMMDSLHQKDLMEAEAKLKETLHAYNNFEIQENASEDQQTHQTADVNLDQQLKGI